MTGAEVDGTRPSSLTMPATRLGGVTSYTRSSTVRCSSSTDDTDSCTGDATEAGAALLDVDGAGHPPAAAALLVAAPLQERREAS